MRTAPWKTYLWPGLALLWHCGLWSGLLVAMAFAVLLNVLLLASLLWVDLLNPWHLRLGWLAFAVLWVAVIAISAQVGRRTLTGDRTPEMQFREGLKHYLQGNWYEAETILARMVKRTPRDVEARLMLATLYRHTGRNAEASMQLDRLELLTAADPWSQEILAERRQIAAATAPATSESESTPETSSPAATRQAA